jgi:DNA polymerase
MKNLALDIETYSDVDLAKCGVYRYCESGLFDILLFGYSVDEGPVQVVDLVSGEKLPEEILDALTDDSVKKWAHNAAFERVCLSRYLRTQYPERFISYSVPEDSVGNYLDPYVWRCSMVWVAYMGLPLSLKDVGRILKLDNQKLEEGKNLVRYFCTPCKPTKTNSKRTRNMPWHDPEKWELFKEYNIRDVEVEQAIRARLKNHPVPEHIWNEYHLSEQINDRGIRVDMTLVENAMKMDVLSKDELTAAMKHLTGLDNPNSVQQMKEWLVNKGVEVDTLGKKAVSAMLKEAPPGLRKVLSLRQQLSKSSVKKYQAMSDCVCADGRARGMFFFYGASRSGRWAGRHIQLQNLPQNHIGDLEEARALVRSGDYQAVKVLYGDIPDTLSQLIRTAFIPKSGMKFIVADFSAIEARVLSFLAGEQWRLDVFANNGDIYCASASQMFKVPVERNGVNAHLRQKGKIAELALGYGGGVAALKAMGALDMGLKEEELRPLVMSWRQSNPRIVKFWWAVDKGVKDAVLYHIDSNVNGIGFSCKRGILSISLPSGRQLNYIKPRIDVNQFGRDAVTYEGMGNTKKWGRIESYGPKFVENIIQAVSRDILAYAMQTLRNCFIVAHVHDELIIECNPQSSVETVCQQMARTPPWIDGLCLQADGYQTEFYRKD